MERYRETARRRAMARRKAVEVRRQRAWEVARTAATLLQDTFGAGRVVIFGSLVHPELFHAASDVDLAVWELDERVYCRAVGRLQSLDPEISVDLIEVASVHPRLRERIENEGEEL